MAESSQILPLIRRIRSKAGKAVTQFNMLHEGDRVLVGLSGGKDSLVLLAVLAHLRHTSPVSFQLEACTVNPGDPLFRTESLAALCRSLEIPYHVIHQDVFSIIKHREERSPCSLCAHMRRGILAAATRDKGCNVLALGHHLDDAVETAQLNLLSSGRFKSFQPKLRHSRADITVIRPLVFLEERRIAQQSEALGLTAVAPSCPYEANTRRTFAKDLVAHITREIPDFKSKVLHALCSIDPADRWAAKGK
ncbi:MAG: tRNA 2-thiocytidine biosynthesis protein TtcA [Synergistales bacterium]|nr:tRNA 2-thiocytidine biosynthesis protein TtcA [Synergistales bacterium]